MPLSAAALPVSADDLDEEHATSAVTYTATVHLRRVGKHRAE